MRPTLIADCTNLAQPLALCIAFVAGDSLNFASASGWVTGCAGLALTRGHARGGGGDICRNQPDAGDTLTLPCLVRMVRLLCMCVLLTV